MTGFVYEWTNLINGKKYIGSHRGTPDDGYVGSGKIFLQAVRKYGILNFERRIIESVSDPALLQERETFHLLAANAADNPDYYNLKNSGGGSWSYVNKCPVRREKALERCRWMGERSQRFRGKKHTPDAMERTRSGWDEWAKKNLKRAVIQHDLEMNFLAEFDSLSEAARAVGGSPSNIKYHIEGAFKTAYGFIWRYKTVT